MFTIPNQSSVLKAYLEFDDAGRMKPSPYYARVVDVMAELVKFTVQLRDARNSWGIAIRGGRKTPSSYLLRWTVIDLKPCPECPLWVQAV